MEELDERFTAAARACDDIVVWHARRGPAETMALLAGAAEELGIDDWTGTATRARSAGWRPRWPSCSGSRRRCSSSAA